MIPYNKDTAYKAAGLGKSGGVGAIDGETIIKNDDGKLQVYPGGSGWSYIEKTDYNGPILIKNGTSTQDSDTVVDIPYATEMYDYASANLINKTIAVKFRVIEVEPGQESRRFNIFTGDEDVVEGTLNFTTRDDYSIGRNGYSLTLTRPNGVKSNLEFYINKTTGKCHFNGSSWYDLVYYTHKAVLELNEEGYAFPVYTQVDETVHQIDAKYQPITYTFSNERKALQNIYPDLSTLQVNYPIEINFIDGTRSSDGRLYMKNQTLQEPFGKTNMIASDLAHTNASRSNIYVDDNKIKFANHKSTKVKFNSTNWNNAITNKSFIKLSISLTKLLKLCEDIKKNTKSLDTYFNGSNRQFNLGSYDYVLWENGMYANDSVLNMSYAGYKYETITTPGEPFRVSLNSNNDFSLNIQGGIGGYNTTLITDQWVNLGNIPSKYLKGANPTAISPAIDTKKSNHDESFITLIGVPKDGSGINNRPFANSLVLDSDGVPLIYKEVMEDGCFEIIDDSDVTTEDIPSANAPTSDGNYVLKCTVTGGVPTYTWVAE